MDLIQRSERVRWFRLTLLGGVLTVTAVILFGVFHSAVISEEAKIYEEIARQLISNTTEGRQATVSSLWWPPLCTLIRVPLVFLMPDDGFPWASMALGAVAGFFVISMLWRSSKLLAGKVRAVALCLMLACSPFFIAELINGSSTLMLALLGVIAADSLAKWLTGRSVRALVYYAISSSLLCGMSPELTIWLAMMMILFIADLIHSRSMSTKHKEAVLIIGLLPAAYILSLWFLMNWLIMGDALYFLRPLWRARLLPTVAGGGLAKLGLLHFACGLIPAFTAGISAGFRNKTGLLWSVFALLLFVSALLFRQAGLLWEDTHILGVLPIFIFFTAVAAMGHVEGGTVAGWRKLLIALPVLVMSLSFASIKDAPQVRDEEVQQLSVIERHVMARSKYAKVFVCGYDSFSLLRGRSSTVFARSLDFNFNKAKNDYRGHDLFVMIKKPAGKGTGDSIHWKYDDVYSLGSEQTLYDTDWGDWRMFQIIQAAHGGASE